MYVDRELVRRVEFSAAEFCVRHASALARTSPDSGATATGCDGGALIAFGPGRYVNRAMGLGLGGTAADQIVAAITDFYSARSLPASLEICPWVDPALIEALSASAFQLERFRNVYVYDLAFLPDETTVDIRPVDASSARERMAILSGDAPEGSDARQISDEFCISAAALPDTHDFVALVNDDVAACGSLNIVDGVGWLGGAATRLEHRGQGLQLALLAYRLRQAQSLSCDFAACTAVPDGQSARNLERLGFQLLYTQTVLTQA